jgi:tetratricopeptide (TPR) repeat protein/SAM-dependent methyltransferase
MAETGSPAPEDISARIDGMFELAMRRHQAGELRAAEELYRAILAADPRQLDCLHLLGMIALQDGRPEAAVELIGQAIAANDRVAAYHASIAEAYRALGRRDEAIAHDCKAVALDPRDWAAHYKLAEALRENGDLEAAAEHYAQAAAIKPDLASALYNLAAVHLTLGRANDALEAASRAVAAKDSDAARTLFVQCVRAATALPGDPTFREMLTRALSEGWGRPVELAGPAVVLVKNNPEIAAAIALAMAAWPQRVSPGAIGRYMGTLAAHDLLRSVMDSTPIRDVGLERLLTSVRTILLDAAMNTSSDVSPELLAFSCSLARQCFINEYVFDVSEFELKGLAWLRGSVTSALTGRSPVFAIHIITLAAYAPLPTLDRAPGLLSRKWAAPVNDLITEQVREPEQEAQLGAAMPRLTAIADDVSVRVRQQYEDNPYPRWIKAAPVTPANGIAAYLRAEFPLAPLHDRPEPGALDILVAGCGTGQQPIETARRFPDARVLAIDLSLASLAYAQRKSAAASVAIEFGQADIAALSLPGRSFDVIEASGVLHHLADPMRGWSTLLALLKPGGFMRLGLYSELARADIVAVRQLIAERGYHATPHDIRRCRQELISAQEARFANILESPDFYNTSACRDLLFHVQEHRLTLPEISAFLERNGLSFLGFELDAPLLVKYGSQFPDDPAMTDLDHWHRFETENPDTFGSMYQFWVQKAL